MNGVSPGVPEITRLHPCDEYTAIVYADEHEPVVSIIDSVTGYFISSYYMSTLMEIPDDCGLDLGEGRIILPDDLVVLKGMLSTVPPRPVAVVTDRARGYVRYGVYR